MDYDDIEFYDFELPAELIAAEPVSTRSDSRLLVFNRATSTISHHPFRELPSIIEGGELMVFNDSRVLPARLYGTKDTGGSVELLVVDVESEAEDRWTVPGIQIVRVMCRASKSPKIGSKLTMPFGELEVLDRLDDGMLVVKGAFLRGIQAELQAYGEIPLPPYIVKRREELGGITFDDGSRYQTVFANRPGSVAAPTAGLHFDDGIFSALDERGITRTSVTLDVGPGTFKPVSAPRLSGHLMHAERYSISEDASALLRDAKSTGRKIIAVGTTTTRVLEAEIRRSQPFVAGSRATDIFLRPGNPPQYVDALVTNFHLPRSTLLAMISAFVGVEAMREIYQIAIGERYRFYSYGDAMLIM